MSMSIGSPPEDSSSNRITKDSATELQSDELARYRLAAIIESADDAIISKTLDSIITSWNKGAERIFGYTAEEVIGKPVTILIPANHPDEEPAILARLRAGERIEHYETVRVRKDGTLINISLTVSPIRGPDGKIIGASKIARDITDKKRAEKERERLLESEQQARAQAEVALEMHRSIEERLGLLVEASGVLLGSLSIEAVQPAILDLSRRLISADAYAIWRQDAESGAWRIVSSAGMSESYNEQTIHGSDQPQYALDEPVVAEDVTELPILSIRRKLYEAEGIKSLLVVPLRIHG